MQGQKQEADKLSVGKARKKLIEPIADLRYNMNE